MTDRTDTKLTSTTSVSVPAMEDHEHPQGSTRTVLGRFPASHPRGSRPAEEYAAARRAQGQTAHVVMHLPTDTFLVVTTGGAR